MVKRTLELFECDVCGEEGARYTVTYPDGQMTLDRCDRHGAKLLKLKEEKGAWVAKSPGSRSGFKISTLDEIQEQKARK